MARIGIMSFAHMHARSYAACLNELAEADLAAVWDDNHARGKKAAKEFGSVFVSDLKKFLALDTQGVIVTSENVGHRALVEAAAAAGKWVLCEKPLAPTVADAKAIVTACKRAKVGLGTAFPVRYSTPMKTVRQMLVSGEYGEMYAASSTNNGQFPGGWFGKQAMSGGGATMDHTACRGRVALDNGEGVHARLLRKRQRASPRHRHRRHRQPSHGNGRRHTG